MKPIKASSNYFQIELTKNENVKKHLIHRLVLLTFNGESKLDVNHKDGNKLNNRLDNLEYVTKSENTKHAYDNKLMTRKGTKHNNSKFSKKDLKKVKKLLSQGMLQKNIAKIFNVDSSTISKIKTNVTYKEEY